jgi:aspartate-semialdehyde dehydrogenase
MNPINVGVLGATGMVGQNYLRLLENHPWFRVTYVAASPRSAGKTYRQAVAGRWHMSTAIPAAIRDVTVADANRVNAALGQCQLVFSAVEADKATVRQLEEAYAAADIPVVSNNSAHRATPDVPMMIPEVNAAHAALIDVQRRQRDWNRGFIAVKPNCSVQSYVTPFYALREAGYPVARAIVTTLQAISGAGFPGPASLQMIDNCIPYIGGEEEKSEQEPQRLLGRLSGECIALDTTLEISAHCNRVPVIDGHMACVSIEFAGDAPAADEILRLWREFEGEPQRLGLPSAPRPAMVYHDEADRPQPRMDRDCGAGMTVTLGRLRPCHVFDYRFVGLSHNTVRGAAGGAILTAELLRAKGYID